MKVKLQDIIDALEWDVDSAVVDDFYKVANTIADSRGFINTDNAEFQLFLRDFLESHELDYQYDLIKNVLEPYKPLFILSCLTSSETPKNSSSKS